ncbi:H-NS histone family protein [Caballeronia sp. LZ034LL]|uniref:H-NS histone family protein n=1 Tax=Caballeronia sp. LZ034LL TaxID=3038567 RepID=UPI00285D25C2|nr:H-NS histone family protein [Caballeronia sp. LZ034LL]MDR5838438.1 H-NS histone family protein [Caballeronia sp. LZ034LL]
MATLKQIQARLRKLQERAESLIADHAQAVLDDIRAMMERHGLAADDTERLRKKSRRAAKPNVAIPAPVKRHEAVNRAAKTGKLPAKYRNPETGETWSGWARPPAWIANVKDRSRFLIDAEGVEVAVKPKAKAAAKSRPKPAAKKSAAVPARKTSGRKTASRK